MDAAHSAYVCTDGRVIVLKQGPESVSNAILYTYSDRTCHAEQLLQLVASGTKFTKDMGQLATGGRQVRTIRIPNTVRAVLDNAFAQASALLAVCFPEGLERIGDNAFFGCVNPERVNLIQNSLIIEDRSS